MKKILKGMLKKILSAKSNNKKLYAKDSSIVTSLDGVDRFATVKMPYPDHLLLAVSFNCLAKCPHCYLLQQNNDIFLKNTLMSEELFDSVVESPYILHAKKVTFTGGEALLHPQLFDWIKVVSSKGVDNIASITNGLSLLKEKNIENLLNETKLTSFNISLDATTAAEYNSAKGLKNCNFDLICRNIKLLSERFKGTKTRVSGSFVVQYFDSKRVRKVIQFAESLGLHKINLHSLHVIPEQNRMKSPGIQNGALGINEIIEQITSWNDYSTDITVKLPFRYAKKHQYCVSLGRYLCLGATGELAPCCHVPWNSCYGTFDKVDSNLINHSNIKKMRHDFIVSGEKNNNLLMPEPCRYCIKRTSGHLSFFSRSKVWDVY